MSLIISTHCRCFSVLRTLAVSRLSLSHWLTESVLRTRTQTQTPPPNRRRAHHSGAARFTWPLMAGSQRFGRREQQQKAGESVAIVSFVSHSALRRRTSLVAAVSRRAHQHHPQPHHRPLHDRRVSGFDEPPAQLGTGTLSSHPVNRLVGRSVGRRRRILCLCPADLP